MNKHLIFIGGIGIDSAKVALALRHMTDHKTEIVIIGPDTELPDPKELLNNIKISCPDWNNETEQDPNLPEDTCPPSMWGEKKRKNKNRKK